MTTRAFGHSRAWLATALGFMNLGEAEAICTGRGMGGEVGGNDEMGSEDGDDGPFLGINFY